MTTYTYEPSEAMRARWAAFDASLREDVGLVIDLAAEASAEVARVAAWREKHPDRPARVVAPRGSSSRERNELIVAEVIAAIGEPPARRPRQRITAEGLRWAQFALDAQLPMIATGIAMGMSASTIAAIVERGDLTLPEE